MTDSSPPSYVGEYKRWRDAAPEERRQLLQQFPAAHSKLLPTIAELRDSPEAVIMPNGVRLVDCDAAALSEMATYFNEVRIAVRARHREIMRCDDLAGVRI